MQKTKTISQCSKKSNKCSTSLHFSIALFFCFCVLRIRLLSQGEKKSDLNLLSVISHKNYLSHAAKKYDIMHTASPTNSLKYCLTILT